SIASTSNTTKGLFFENSQTNFRQQHIYVDDVVVHGFGDAGISLRATNPTIDSGGFDDVRITNSVVYSNGRSGIASSVSSSSGLVVGGTEYDYYARAHANLYVANNIVRDTTGKSESGGVSGNGIVLAQFDGAVIERNVAHHNGGQAGGGGVGIWAWQGNDVSIQFNEAYANQTFDGRDGGGFDLDGGVTNSRLQYNYSHGNDGAGLGLFQFGYASKMGGNVIRYNISEADGAGISVWGNGPRFPGSDVAEDSIYHNNTVINPLGPAVHFFGSVDDVGVYNNILVSQGGEPLVQLDDWDGNGNSYVLDADLRGNAYWSGDDSFRIEWAGAEYADLAAWANATGQEKMGGALVGRQVDPLLFGPFAGGVALDDPDLLESLAAYRLRGVSPLVDGGIDWTTLPLAVALGLTDPGTRDFFGGPILAGGTFDVGAHEAAIAGDFNRDGVVDAADYTIWRDTLGQIGAALAADSDGDGTVTAADYIAWAAQFGAGGGSASQPAAMVPEPVALLFALVGSATASLQRCGQPRKRIGRSQ
ncbi:MAG: dockerin type I domain-containing protein, partial [Pirellulales bacterium]